MHRVQGREREARCPAHAVLHSKFDEIDLLLRLVVGCDGLSGEQPREADRLGT